MTRLEVLSYRFGCMRQRVGFLFGLADVVCVRLARERQTFHLPAAHRAGPFQQQAVRLVEHQEGMGVPRLRKGGGDVLLGAADEWIEQIRGAFVQHRQAHPRRKMAHPGAFARARRPGQQERDGEGRVGAQQVRCQRREIAIGVDQFQVVGGVVLRLRRRQATAVHRTGDTFDDQPCRLRPATGEPCRPERRRGDSGRGRHKPGEACSVCLRQHHTFRFTHPPPQPCPRDQVRDLQLQAHGHPAQHRRAEHADIIRRPNHRHRHALQQAMHEHARACRWFVESAAAAPDEQILRLVE